jgi:hypothetical protein
VNVFLGRGPPEVGHCPEDRAGLCLDVGFRYARWSIRADLVGRATLDASLAAYPLDPGEVVTIQAAAARGTGGVLSDPIETVVEP